MGEQLNAAGAWLQTVHMQKEAGCVWVGRTCRWNTWKLPCCSSGRSPGVWKVGRPCVPSAFSFSFYLFFFCEVFLKSLLMLLHILPFVTVGQQQIIMMIFFFFLSTDLSMTVQSKGTSKPKVKISPVCLEIVISRDMFIIFSQNWVTWHKVP